MTVIAGGVTVSTGGQPAALGRVMSYLPAAYSTTDQPSASSSGSASRTRWKHGKTIGEISPINLRDLLKTPCPECGRRDYVPGKNSVCNHCGHQFEFATDSAPVYSRDKDPAYNCVVGTDMDVACPTCGKHAWKKYGYHQNIRCRCCGSDHPTNKLELNAFGKLFFTLLFFPLVIPFFLLFKIGKNAHNKL